MTYPKQSTKIRISELKLIKSNLSILIKFKQVHSLTVISIYVLVFAAIYINK